MKNLIKILSIATILLYVFITYSIAGDATEIGKFLNETTSAANNAGSVLDAVLSVVQIIGIAVAVIMLVIIGIKYMISSVSDRADIKKHAIVYVTGAILLFGASGIVQIIKEFSKDIN